MSTHLAHRDAADVPGGTEEDLVSVRRNVVLNGFVGGVALLLAIAFLARGESFLDVLLGLAMLVVAGLNLPALLSARTPVLVADQHGIRMRVGLTWRGLPWSAVRQVVVEEPASLLGEGRLVIVPRDRQAVLRRLGPEARLHLRWNRYFYGASLSLPLGITTVVDTVDTVDTAGTAGPADLGPALSALAQGRVEIVDLRESGTSAPVALATVPPTAREYTAEGLPIPDEDDEPTQPVLPLREVSSPNRVDVRIEPPREVEDYENVAELRLTDDVVPSIRLIPEQVQRSGGSTDGAPEWDELPVDVVIDDLAPVRPPVTQPVIGAKVAHARECLDMSIEELSQRTRIRPHVLEAIERDDFAPCGGDFYARGHLTAISRALGLTLDPLLAEYDERYAQAPITPRRVFEAELTAGSSGGLRSAMTGPRWSLLIGAVLSLTMIWGLARVFAGDPEQLSVAPESAETAGLAGAQQTPITSPKMRTSTMTVRAAFAGTHVVVKDRTGRTLWSGDLGIGKQRKVVGLAPFRVSADNAGAVVVTVKGKPLGTIGTAGVEGSKNFG